MLPDGTWTVLWGQERGARDETPGILLRLPPLTIDAEEMEDYIQSGGGSQDDYLAHEAFYAERDKLATILRDELSDQLAILDAAYDNHVNLPTTE